MNMQAEDRSDTRSLPPGTVAVLIPCYNEEVTIGKVVDDFRRVLPGAEVWVGGRHAWGTTPQPSPSSS